MLTKVKNADRQDWYIFNNISGVTMEKEPWAQLWTPVTERTGWVSTMSEAEEVRRRYEVVKSISMVSSKKEGFDDDDGFKGNQYIIERVIKPKK